MVRVFGTIILIFFIAWLIYTLFQVPTVILSGILAFISVVIAGILTHLFAKSREIEARHFDVKREGYTAFIDVMMQQIQNVNLGKNGRKASKEEREMQKNILEYKKVLLIWGDSDVIKMWNKFEEQGQSINKNTTDILFVMDELLRSMRKDLGKTDLQLKKGELVSLLLKPEEKHKVLERDE